MKLTPMSLQVMEYVQENGGKVSIPEIVETTGRVARSINASVTDLTNKELAVREKEAVEGEDKLITYVVLTEAGRNFVQPSEEE